MKATLRMLGLGLGAAALFATAGLAQRASTTPDTMAIARTLVTKSANIRSGELVWIHGGTRDQELLEDIAVEVRKLGAHPLITVGSDRLTRRMIMDVPAKYDDQEPTFELRLADVVDAVIAVDFQERPDLLADVPAARLARRAQAEMAIYQKMLDRNVLSVHLGNGLYPTAAGARQFGLNQEQLSRIFWQGVNTDYQELQATGSWVKNVLASGREVKITAPNGTDLALQIRNREVFVSDGVISSEDRYAGGPAAQVWLPAGEIYVTPVPKTAEGTFVADTFFFEGKLIEGLKLTFEKGRLTSMTAKSDISALKKHYEAAPKGRDAFAAIDIGINPDIEIPRGSDLVTWMASGTISVGFGNNVWAGGDNEVPFDLFAHLTNGTLTVDGRTLIDRGQLLKE